jgi:5-formyltetrahydrofolate cyclo-ligase
MVKDKVKLRMEMRLRRAQILESTRVIAEKAISKNFTKYFSNTKSKIISGFKAINNEPNLDELYLKLATQNILCFPTIINNNLVFKQWREGQEFILNKKFQTLEPKLSSLSVVPDILLVPLLAADMHGNRLGYGGGFYDRYLQYAAKIKKITAIGICFEAQIIDAVPIDLHDQKLDFILTDNRVIRV